MEAAELDNCVSKKKTRMVAELDNRSKKKRDGKQE